eukprot:scaffold25904_cov67-Phaeocystis_antarctica.AAC.3
MQCICKSTPPSPPSPPPPPSVPPSPSPPPMPPGYVQIAGGYYMIESGSCGGALISTTSECEAAATALDLSDETATDGTLYWSPFRPPGCVFRVFRSSDSLSGSLAKVLSPLTRAPRLCSASACPPRPTVSRRLPPCRPPVLCDVVDGALTKTASPRACRSVRQRKEWFATVKPRLESPVDSSERGRWTGLKGGGAPRKTRKKA